MGAKQIQTCVNLMMAMLMVTTLASDGADVNRRKADKPKAPDAVMFLAPLNDAIDINAGTLEVRFALNYSFSDYIRPDLSVCTPFRFISLLSKDGTPMSSGDTTPWFNLHFRQKRGFHTILYGNNHHYSAPDAEPEQRNSSLGVNSDEQKGPWFKKGEWHSLAATWCIDDKDVMQLELFLDGKSYKRQSFPKKSSSLRPLAKDDLIGIGGLDVSEATLLSYRISNRVRTKEEIASDKPLTPDDATTFFLDGTTAGQCKVLSHAAFAELIKNKSVTIKDKGTFVGSPKFVNTPKGKVIQFSTNKTP
jgi:hypothetical protein